MILKFGIQIKVFEYFFQKIRRKRKKNKYFFSEKFFFRKIFKFFFSESFFLGSIMKVFREEFFSKDCERNFTFLKLKINPILRPVML